MRDEIDDEPPWYGVFALERQALRRLPDVAALSGQGQTQGQTRGLVLYAAPGAVVTHALARSGDPDRALAGWLAGAGEILGAHRAARRSLTLMRAETAAAGLVPERLGPPPIRDLVQAAAGALVLKVDASMAELAALALETDPRSAACLRMLAAATSGAEAPDGVMTDGGMTAGGPRPEALLSVVAAALAAQAWQAERDAERRVAARLADQVADLEEAVLENAAARWQAEAAGRQAQDAATARESELARAKETSVRNLARMGELEDELGAARARIDALERSTSWRMTAPVRRAADFLKRLR